MVSLLGIGYTIFRPRRGASWILILSALIFLAVMGKGHIAARRYLSPSIPWLLLPGVAVIITVLALNILGDGLRDAADPYSH